MTTARSSMNDQIRWASGLNILAGLWLLISPWVLGFTDLQNGLWNNVILGIVIAIVAAIRASGYATQTWLAWLNVILGAWVVISPWVLGFQDNQTPLWNNVITGVVVIVLAAWSGLASPRETTARPGM